MAKAIIRPTSHIDYTGSSTAVTNKYVYKNCANAYDNDSTTLMYAQAKGYGAVVFTEFDTQSIPKNIASIKNIKVCLLANGAADINTKVVHSATTTSNYTDCGDGTVTITTVNYTNPTVFSADFAQATSYWDSNLSAFLNGEIQVRISNVNTSNTANICEVYLEVEYELPIITVTTSSSPAEGGTVSGGGTYESGSTVTLTAMPNSGYAFSHWQIGETIVGTENPISGPLTTDVTVTAVFVKVETSKVCCGTKKCSVYAGTKRVGVYAGTKKLS